MLVEASSLIPLHAGDSVRKNPCEARRGRAKDT